MMKKSGVEQLREEKYRFTTETQGLLYPKHHRSDARDEETTWSDDDSDSGFVAERKSSPMAQRMATELARVMEERGSKGFTDDVLERLLAGSLQTSSDAAGYGVAKDYIKQVLDQLYGQNTTSKPELPEADGISVVQASRNLNPALERGLVAMDSSSSTSAGAHELDSSLANVTLPGVHAAGSGLMAPPWTAAVSRGSATGTGGTRVAAAQGASSDEVEHPRPRPHHSRIKEQLDLLQNADQLATIISVATTAATTAAAAAIKQTMHTQAPLPPGAYARMHAGGQPMLGVPMATESLGTNGRIAQRQQLGSAPTSQAATDTLDDQSPDPLPQQRQGALVPPHRRSTPLVMTWRHEAGLAAAGTTDDLGSSHGEHDGRGGPIKGLGPVISGAEAQLKKHRLRWSQLRAVPLSPYGPGGDEHGVASPGKLGSTGTAGTGSSNLRVVCLGTPRVTARTPNHARFGNSTEAGAHSQEQTHADQDATKGAELGLAEAVGRTNPSGEEAEMAIGGNHDAVEGHRGGKPPRMRANPADKNQASASHDHAFIAVVPQRSATAHAAQPDLPDVQKMSYDQNVNKVHHQQFQQAREAPAAAAQVESDGFFIAGGESVFARANLAAALSRRQSVTGEVATKASELGPRRPRRSAMPEDVQEAFRSTLAFISDPDGARARKHQSPSWAAMADIEERKQAQREAEELLGGAFDYTAVKRELERARRTSWLLQDVAKPSRSLTCVDSTANARAGLRAAGRVPPLAAQGTAATTGLQASVALQPRGDFAGLLPPPHSVWDVDDAWFDLDEYTKAIEAEVAYRAAAAAAATTGPSRRGSPGPKQGGLTATNLAVAPVSRQTSAARAGTRPSARRVSLDIADTAELPAVTVRTEQSDTTESRKRSVSPGQKTSYPLRKAAASETSPSPPRAASKAQASGPVRIAFGRRVDEPSKAAEVRTSRARLRSPQKKKVAPGQTRSKTPNIGGIITTPSAAALSSPSSTGDVVVQVLSALASVLLSDNEEAEAADDGVAGPEVNTVASTCDTGGLISTMAETVPHRETREVAAQAGRTGSPASFRHVGEPESSRRPREPMAPRSAAAAAGSTVPLALPPKPALLPQQLVGAGSELSGRSREENVVHDDGSKNAPDDTAGQMQVGNVAPEAADSSDARTATASLQEVGTLPFLDTSALTSRPQFQVVIDTAHPPTTRLPAWAASATAAEGGPAAYVAALATAPTGLGFSSLAKRQPARPTALSLAFRPMRPQNGNEPNGQHEALSKASPTQQGGGADNIIPESSASYWQRQATQLHISQPTSSPPAFPAPRDLPSSTNILPPDAAAAAMAAASVSAKAAGRHTSYAIPDQEWEEAVLHAVEDEVVGRLAAVQLAAKGQGPRVEPQDLAGMLPPLVDAELSRRLVCDVLLDNLRSLLEKQQQGSSTDLGTDPVQGTTLEEVVAALVAMPVLPRPREQEPPSQPETVGQAAAEIAENEPTSYLMEGIIPVPGTPFGESPLEIQDTGVVGNGDNGSLVGSGSSHDMAQPDTSIGLAVPAAAHAEDWSAGVLGALPSAPVLQTWEPIYAGQSSHQLAQPVQVTPEIAASGTLQGDVMRTLSTRVGVSTAHEMSDPTMTPRKEQGTSALPDFSVTSWNSTDQSSPRKSQGIQAHGVQGRGVQAYGAETRGVQAFGVVQARAVQAHGIEARATQAAGVQERATQASGVMDRSSQADPPVPQYLLQAALAAGLSYGAGSPFTQQGVASNGVWARNAVLAPDGAPLSMQQPFFLVPADNSQLSFPLGLYGATLEIPAARGEVNRPPLKLPGLSKLRDSSDVDSSTDSMGANSQAPGSRARAATAAAAGDALLASRMSLTSDDGVLQRSYAQLELASLTARPVRLNDQHIASSEQSLSLQPSTTMLRQPRSDTTQHLFVTRYENGERGTAATGNSDSSSLPCGNSNPTIDFGAGTVAVAGDNDSGGSQDGVSSKSDPPSQAPKLDESLEDTCSPTYIMQPGMSSPPSQAPELQESLDGAHSFTYITQPSVLTSSSSTVTSVVQDMLTSGVHADESGGGASRGAASERSETDPHPGSENVASETAVGQITAGSSSMGSTASTSRSQPAASGPPKAASVLPQAMPRTGDGEQQSPGSPSQPPSLENYQGPTRQLWRPPPAQEARDPLISSSETLMASSEASGPTLNPLTHALVNAQHHARKSDLLTRAQAAGLEDSIDSSVEVSTSIDSMPANFAHQTPTNPGVMVPRQLTRIFGPTAGALGSQFQTRNVSESESDEEGPVTGDEDQAPSMEVAGLGRAFSTERGNARHDGAVFRLRQYGARRRKLMQQIGIKDPLLMSNTSTASTDSSTISDSIGDEGSTLLRRLSTATRRL